MNTNHVTLIGFVGGHLTRTKLLDDCLLVRMRVATTQLTKSRNGQTFRQTHWHDVVAFDALASYAEQNFVKGSRIMVHGSIDYRTWEDKSGQKRYYTDIKAYSLTNLDR